MSACACLTDFHKLLFLKMFSRLSGVEQLGNKGLYTVELEAHRDVTLIGHPLQCSAVAMYTVTKACTYVKLYQQTI